MAKEDYKKVTVELRKEVWIQLKITSLQKDLSLQQVVSDIIDKSVSRSKTKSEENIQ